MFNSFIVLNKQTCILEMIVISPLYCEPLIIKIQTNMNSGIDSDLFPYCISLFIEQIFGDSSV